MKQIILAVFAMIMLASCEKEIEVDTPPHESRLVINSHTYEGDTIVVSVGKSVGVKEYKYKNSQIITDAIVTLTVDGVSEILKYDASMMNYYSKTVAQKGKTYTLKVSAKGFQDAEATATMLDPVSMTSVKVTPNVRNTSMYGMQDEVKITFSDPGTMGDYYMLKIGQMVSYNPYDTGYYYSYTPCISSADPSIADGQGGPMDEGSCLPGDGICFTDNLFNSSTKELKLYVGTGTFNSVYVDENGDTLKPTIEFYHISKDYYLYKKTTRYAWENDGNPFAEPVSIYTNIKNGYGIFCMSTADIRTVE